MADLDYTIGFEAAKKAALALDKKFPFSKQRKQDIDDALAIRKVCEGIDPANFEDLADVGQKIGRLKKRVVATEALVTACRAKVEKMRPGPKAATGIRNANSIAEKKAAKKSDDEKAKIVCDLLTDALGAATAHAVYWGTVLNGAATQMKATNRIGVHAGKARAALKKAIYDSPDDAEHLKLAQKGLADLAIIDEKVGESYGEYWIMQSDLKKLLKPFGPYIKEMSAAVLKLKAKSAADFLQKLVA
ncbi:MAG: hypothetical protein AAGB05_17720 [Pseudomonadota bacterium]